MVGQVPDRQRDHHELLRRLLRQLHAAELQLERREAVHQRLLREGGRKERLEGLSGRAAVIGSRCDLDGDGGVAREVRHHSDDGEASVLLLADAG